MQYQPTLLTTHSYIEARKLNPKLTPMELAKVYGEEAVKVLEKLFKKLEKK